MKRRGTPEADLQRAVVVALRFALPKGAIIHHCVNEVTEAGPRGAKRQAILVGMGARSGIIRSPVPITSDQLGVPAGMRVVGRSCNGLALCLRSRCKEPRMRRSPCVSVVVRRSVFPLFLRWAG